MRPNTVKLIDTTQQATEKTRLAAGEFALLVNLKLIFHIACVSAWKEIEPLFRVNQIDNPI